MHGVDVGQANRKLIGITQATATVRTLDIRAQNPVLELEARCTA